MHVLFITPWYPNRKDAMDGLFVRKHAQAVSRLASVSVVCLKTDSEINTYRIESEDVDDVTEVVVSFPYVHLPLISTFSKAINFIRAFRKAFQIIKHRNGMPDVCQVNVLTRCGLPALWLKRHYGIPYIVVEHWTRYLPTDFHYTGFLRRKLTETVVRNASILLPVSHQLGKAMVQCGLRCPKMSVVNNVVDDFFYDECSDAIPRNEGKKRLLHVSGFTDEQKNILGILRSVKQLSLRRTDFELVMVGQGKDFNAAQSECSHLGLNALVSFVGEQPPSGVFRWLKSSDAFILFSNFENAPVVISECLATGVPIVSSNVGGIPDMVDCECGILVEPHDENGLTIAISEVLDHPERFAPEHIRQKGKQFSFACVGERLMQAYNDALTQTI